MRGPHNRRYIFNGQKQPAYGKKHYRSGLGTKCSDLLLLSSIAHDPFSGIQCKPETEGSHWCSSYNLQGIKQSEEGWRLDLERQIEKTLHMQAIPSRKENGLGPNTWVWERPAISQASPCPGTGSLCPLKPNGIKRNLVAFSNYVRMFCPPMYLFFQYSLTQRVQ